MAIIQKIKKITHARKEVEKIVTVYSVGRNVNPDGIKVLQEPSYSAISRQGIYTKEMNSAYESYL